MTYQKTNWAMGDTITAEKLNNMENGIENANSSGGGALIVHPTGSGAGKNSKGGIESVDIAGIDKSYNELKAALDESKTVMLLVPYLEDGLNCTGIFYLSWLNDEYFASFTNIRSYTNIDFFSEDPDAPMLLD